MAINPVRVVTPPREQKEPKERKLSDLEKIMQGLQIVQTGFGIAANFTKIGSEMRRQKKLEADTALVEKQTEVLGRPKAGDPKMSFIDKAVFEGKAREVPEGTEGAVAFTQPAAGPATQAGELPTASRFFLPKAVEDRQRQVKLDEIDRLDREDDKVKALQASFKDPTIGIRKAAESVDQLDRAVAIFNQEGASGIQDISAINNLARTLSPGPVTEEDISNIVDSSGLEAGAKAALQRAWGEGVLLPEQRIVLLKTMRSLSEAKLGEYDKIVNEYRQRAGSEEIFNRAIGQRFTTKTAETRAAFDQAIARLEKQRAKASTDVGKTKTQVIDSAAPAAGSPFDDKENDILNRASQ